LILAAVLFTCTADAEGGTVGARWLSSGTGFAERGFVRVRLNADGVLDIKSTDVDGTENITGYEAWGGLNASLLGINTWGYHNKYELSLPIEVGSFNPTVNEPFRLPSFTIDRLTYTVVLTDENSGTVNISGYVDIDMVGDTEINANCAIWREGTPKPETPDTESGCDVGAGALGFIALAALLLRGRNSKR
jgi:hypothetical protein